MSTTAPIVLDTHQRVYRNKGSHRLIGIVADVTDVDKVRVHWADVDNTSSQDTPMSSLTAVTINSGATVVRGRTKPAQAISAGTPTFGVVTSISTMRTFNRRTSGPKQLVKLLNDCPH